MQFWVDRYEHVLFSSDLQVSDFDLLLDVVLELFPAGGICDVDDELLRQLRYLLQAGHIESELVPLTDMCEDGFHLESLVGWDRQVLDLVR